MQAVNYLSVVSLLEAADSDVAVDFVNEICAEHFGGGGHLNAAGGEFHGTLEEAAEAFRALMAENKKKYINKKQ